MIKCPYYLGGHDHSSPQCHTTQTDKQVSTFVLRQHISLLKSDPSRDDIWTHTSHTRFFGSARVCHQTASQSVQSLLHRHLYITTVYFYHLSISYLPSVLWNCWLGVRKSIRPVKIEWWGVGVVSVWSEVQIVCVWSSWFHCIPKPHYFLPHLNPDWFYLSGTGLPRLSWKRGH